MKRMVRPLGFLLSAILLLSVFTCFGCQKSGGGEEEDTTTVEEGTPVTIVSEGASDYVILYPKNAGTTVVRVAEQLRDAIKDKTGATLQVLSAEKRTESEKEILVGEMDERQVTLDVGKTVRVDDYVIQVIGSRVVVVGGNDARTVSGVRKFITEAVDTVTGNTLTVLTGELSRKDGTYSVTELKLGGADISQYQIVYPAFRESFYSSAVQEIQSRVKMISGIRIKAVSSSAPATEHELLLGDCGRGVSKGLTATGTQHAVVCDGKSVALAAGSSLTAKWGVRNLLDQYLPVELSGMVEIALPTKNEIRETEIGKKLFDGADLRVMSSNMLFLKESDGASRAELLKEIYMEYYPDIIGLQECDPDGHTKVVNQLSSYYSVACRIADGTTSTTSYTPILYRKDHCELLASGSYLFDSRSMGTKTYYLSWAVFKHLPTDKTFAVMSVHCAIVTTSHQENYEAQGLPVPTDSVDGAQMREDNSRQILERLDQLKSTYGATLPVFIMGDMNATATSSSVQILDNDERLGNCIDLATASKSTGKKSFHAIGAAPENGNPVDHMFVTKDTIRVYTHYLNTSTDALKSSDHCQLICEVAWK